MCDHHRTMSGSHYGVVCLICHADLSPEPEPVAEEPQMVPLTQRQRGILAVLVTYELEDERMTDEERTEVEALLKLLEGDGGR